MCLDDSARDRQAEPGTCFLGREERLEDPVPDGLRDAGSVVLYADAHRISVGSGPDRGSPPLRKGFRGVQQQVENQLLEPRRITEHGDFGVPSLYVESGIDACERGGGGVGSRFDRLPNVQHPVFVSLTHHRQGISHRGVEAVDLLQRPSQRRRQ